MEWKDLSDAAGCVLERCWGLFDDKPRSSTWEIGVPYQISAGETIRVTERTIAEIRRYQKDHPHFDIDVSESKITVTGSCDYGSWDV